MKRRSLVDGPNSPTQDISRLLQQNGHFLEQNGRLETDIFYKETNSYDYLYYFSHHLEHTKQSIPYNLAACIIVFVSEQGKDEWKVTQIKDVVTFM